MSLSQGNHEKYGISKSELYRLRKKMQANQRIVVKDYTAGQIAAMKRKLATLEEENQIFRQSGCGTSASIDEKGRCGKTTAK